MISSYPFNVEYKVGDLTILERSIEFNGSYFSKNEIAIVIKVYDRSYNSADIYDCRILLKCGRELDCWFGELINITRLGL